MLPAEVVAAVAQRTPWHGLTAESAKFKRRGCAVRILDDGRWAIAHETAENVKEMRIALRERLVVVRRNASARMDPGAIEAMRAEWERKRAVHGAELARVSRALLVGFPPSEPRAAVLIDLREHAVATFVDERLDDLRARLSTYEVLGGVDVRALLRSLGFDPGQRRLAELGPPQKSKQLNRQGAP